MNQTYCMKCMRPTRDTEMCPYCGYAGEGERLPHVLRPGTILNDQYLLGEPLGQGGFGITYIARDLNLDIRVAIKEYYPNGYAVRNISISDRVTITDERMRLDIQKGKDSFLKEARTLARFRETAGIVDVLNFFEANDTAYIVMEYLDGETLGHRLKRKLFTAAEIFERMGPVFDILKKIHKQNVVHRDISPDNIMMLPDGSLKLMDFGAARLMNYGDQRSVSIVLKAGYAPKEQYSSKGLQGPWTDIYALCATIYKCITGITPDDALDRVDGDDLKWPSELGFPISVQQEAVLKKGMAVFQKDRFQSIGELKAALRAETSDSMEEDGPITVDSMIYVKAGQLAESSHADDLEQAIRLYESIPGWKDSEARAAACRNKLQEAKARERAEQEAHRKNGIYAQAHSLEKKDTVSGLEEAVRLYASITGWRDADSRADACRSRIHKIKAKEEAEQEALRRDGIYAQAGKLVENGSLRALKKAFNLYGSIAGWRDSEKRAADCRGRLSKIKKKRLYLCGAGAVLASVAILITLAVLITGRDKPLPDIQEGTAQTETPTLTPPSSPTPLLEAGTVPASSGNKAGTDQNDFAGEYAVTIWCSGPVIDLTRKQIATFNSTNGLGIRVEATLIETSEMSAVDNMLADVKGGADIFFFPSDQLSRFVQAGVLRPLAANAAAFVKNSNVEAAVTAATMGDGVYAYPVTADNTCFVYYDKSVVKSGSLNDLDKMIADCEAADKDFCFNLTSGWYSSAFFFGTGCKSVWNVDGSGHFLTVEDTFNSAKGFLAAKALNAVMRSKGFVDSSDASEFSNNAGFVISGTWDLNIARSILGSNFGAAPLPRFSVNGEQYQLRQFTGCKLVGVKANDDVKFSAVCQQLAQYLTDEAAQLERFETAGWGPSNIAAAKNEKVLADDVLGSIAQQAVFSVYQGLIDGGWWTKAEALAVNIQAATSDAEIWSALKAYDAAIHAR